MPNIYTPIPLSIRQVLERGLNEYIQAFDKLSVFFTTEIPHEHNAATAKENAAFYREHLQMVQEA